MTEQKSPQGRQNLPLADILNESTVPFAKEQSHGHNPTVLFTSTPAAPTTAGMKSGNEQGVTFSTTRKGLASKRKLVMSPSKPQQGKPVKQVSWVQTENDETTKCSPLSRSVSYTPSTPPLTPSPRKRDLHVLQQYKVHTTRRR